MARIRIRIQGLPGSGSGLRFFAGSGSGFHEYGSETLITVPYQNIFEKLELDLRLIIA